MLYVSQQHKVQSFYKLALKIIIPTAWKCRNILEDAPVSIQPHHAEQSVDFSAAIYADAQVNKTSITPQNKHIKNFIKREFFPLQYNAVQPFPTHPVDSDEYKTIFNALPDALKEVITTTGAEIVPQTIYFTGNILVMMKLSHLSSHQTSSRQP
eukprot:UN08461